MPEKPSLRTAADSPGSVASSIGQMRDGIRAEFALPGAGSPSDRSKSARSSTNSVDASGASLFAGFAGNMNPSDFPSAFMSALPPVMFADRSRLRCRRETGGISRFSRLEFPDMRRFFDSAAPLPGSPITPGRVLPSHSHYRVGTRNEDFGAQ